MSEEELAHRCEMWRALEGDGPIRPADAQRLRELGIYGGAQGIWVDKARTADFSPNGEGVTVGLLHTGSSYADDLADDCILYHYPSTNRPVGRDASEVEATKNAHRLGLPLFVITYPSPSSRFRDVHLGWVEEWDDRSRLFLISFGDEAPQETTAPDDQPFLLTTNPQRTTREVAVRPNQQRFQFGVMKRYGPQCALCDVNIPELLDAAHLCPKEEHGSDDPRNGLVLCTLHHRALDRRLIRIDPTSLAVETPEGRPSIEDLHITRRDLTHLSNLPHADALNWLWNN